MSAGRAVSLSAPQVRKRIAAGRYEYRGRPIVRTTWESDGPRGGTLIRWEVGTYDADGTVVLDDVYRHRTLADAIAPSTLTSEPALSSLCSGAVPENVEAVHVGGCAAGVDHRRQPTTDGAS